MISAALFGLVSLIGLACFLYAVRVWKNTNDRHAATTTLRKINLRLESDLLQSRATTAQISVTPSSLGGAPDGHALWFLSAQGPDGQFVRNSQGEPLWMRNVLYYITVPNPLESVSPFSMVGASGPDGLEDRCPYKVMIRKVIDSDGPTGPNDEDDPESLLSDASPYLTRPSGLNTAPMASEPGLESVEIVGVNVLGFQVQQSGDAFAFDLRAVRRQEAESSLALGTVSLSNHPLTVQARFSVLPQN